MHLSDQALVHWSIRWKCHQFSLSLIRLHKTSILQPCQKLSSSWKDSQEVFFSFYSFVWASRTVVFIVHYFVLDKCIIERRSWRASKDEKFEMEMQISGTSKPDFASTASNVDLVSWWCRRSLQRSDSGCSSWKGSAWLSSQASPPATEATRKCCFRVPQLS